MKNEPRIIELETRLAFFERTIDTLNEVVIDLVERLERLEGAGERMARRVEALEEPRDAAVPVHEVPPHY